MNFVFYYLVFKIINNSANNDKNYVEMSRVETVLINRKKILWLIDSHFCNLESFQESVF